MFFRPIPGPFRLKNGRNVDYIRAPAASFLNTAEEIEGFAAATSKETAATISRGGMGYRSCFEGQDPVHPA